MQTIFSLLICGMLLLSSESAIAASEYNYLIDHPTTLISKAEQCEIQSNQECNFINRVRNDYADFMNQRNSDPQAFGKKIIAAEMQREVIQHEIATLEAGSAAEEAAQLRLKTNEEEIIAIYSILRQTSNHAG